MLTSSLSIRIFDCILPNNFSNEIKLNYNKFKEINTKILRSTHESSNPRCEFHLSEVEKIEQKLHIKGVWNQSVPFSKIDNISSPGLIIVEFCIKWPHHVKISSTFENTAGRITTLRKSYVHLPQESIFYEKMLIIWFHANDPKIARVAADRNILGYYVT